MIWSDPDPIKKKLYPCLKFSLLSKTIDIFLQYLCTKEKNEVRNIFLYWRVTAILEIYPDPANLIPNPEKKYIVY